MMKRLTILIVLASLVTVSGACVARNVTVRVDPNSRLKKTDGVFYALPRTVVGVEIPLIRIEKKKGEFAAFAACFFPDDKANIVEKDSTSFDLGEPVINSRGEPDPREVFMVKIKGHYLEDKTMTLALTETGTLTKITEETTNRTVDVITQAAQTAASLAKSLVPLAAIGEGDLRDLEQFLRTSTLDCIKDDNIRNDVKKLDRLLDLRRTLGTKRAAAVQQEYDALNKEITGDNPPEGIKQLIAAIKLRADIRTLQLLRQSLLFNQAASGQVSGEALRLALEDTDKQITALKNKFIGTSTKETWNAKFEVTPLKEGFGTEKSYQLFEFATDAGVCGSLPIDPVVAFPRLQLPDRFRGCSERKTDIIALKLTLNSDQVSARIGSAFDNEHESGERGFYYRIPAVIGVGVFRGRNEIIRSRLPVAQLGLTASLPASTGGRKTKYMLELYETGAMKNFELGSEALIQPSTIKSLGDAAGTAIDAVKEAEKKAAESKDEAAKVKSMRELLEECKKIKEAQQALGQEVKLPKICTP